MRANGARASDTLSTLFLYDSILFGVSALFLVARARCIARILAHPAHANMPADFQCGVLAISAAEGPIGGASKRTSSTTPRRSVVFQFVPRISDSVHLVRLVVLRATAFSIRPGFTYALNASMHEARSALPATVPAREFSTLA